jgi:hypothetical protein
LITVSKSRGILVSPVIARRLAAPSLPSVRGENQPARTFLYDHIIFSSPWTDAFAFGLVPENRPTPKIRIDKKHDHIKFGRAYTLTSNEWRTARRRRDKTLTLGRRNASIGHAAPVHGAARSGEGGMIEADPFIWRDGHGGRYRGRSPCRLAQRGATGRRAIDRRRRDHH